MKPKTLTLLILTAIVTASVTCRSSTEELKGIAISEYSLKIRENIQKWLSTAARYVSIGSPITDAAKNMGKYSK